MDTSEVRKLEHKIFIAASDAIKEFEAGEVVKVDDVILEFAEDDVEGWMLVNVEVILEVKSGRLD